MNYITSYCKIRNYSLYDSTGCIYTHSEKEISSFPMGCYESLRLQYPKFFKMDTLSKLGIIASEVVLRNDTTVMNDSMSIILANASASLDTDLQYQRSLQHVPSPSLFVYTLPNIAIGEICIRHQLKGDNEFFIFDSFNPSFMVAYLDWLMDTNGSEACIGGWLEVIGEQHDVLLYLVEKRERMNATEHTEEELVNIYQ